MGWLFDSISCSCCEVMVGLGGVIRDWELSGFHLRGIPGRRMGNVTTLNVAAFQFVGSHHISQNVSAIERGVKLAASSHARLLVTQECALCGYPPLEVESIHQINLYEQDDALAHLRGLAAQYNMYLAVGHITSTEQRFFNTVTMLSPDMQPLLPYHKRALWG